MLGLVWTLSTSATRVGVTRRSLLSSVTTVGPHLLSFLRKASMMNLAIGERRMEAENDASGDGGDGGEFEWERKCGSHFWIWKWLACLLLLGLGGERVWRLEKRPPRTVGRFWEGLR